MATASSELSPRPSRQPMVSEGWAKWLGIPLLTLLTAAAAAWSVYEMFHVLWRLFFLAVDAYAVIAVCYFWASRSFMQGVTCKELFYNVFWFLGLRKLVRSARTDGLQHAGGIHIKDHSDSTWHIGPARTSIGVAIGLLLTVIASGLVPLLVALHLLKLIAAMAWFTVAFWTFCDAVFYLVGRVWRGGVTGKEVFLTFFGGPFAIAWLVVKSWRRRHHQQTVVSSVEPLPAVA